MPIDPVPVPVRILASERRRVQRVALDCVHALRALRTTTNHDLATDVLLNVAIDALLGVIELNRKESK